MQSIGYTGKIEYNALLGTVLLGAYGFATHASHDISARAAACIGEGCQSPMISPFLMQNAGTFAVLCSAALLIDGTVKPFFSEATQKVNNFLKSYSLRNDTVVATHCITGGLLFSITGFSMGLPPSAGITGLVAAATGAIFAKKNWGSNRIQGRSVTIDPLKPFMIKTGSPLHVDTPALLQDGNIGWNSLGAALEGRKFKPSHLETNHNSFYNQPVEVIREIIDDALENDSNVLTEDWQKETTSAAAVHQHLEETMQLRYGIGIQEASLNPRQKEARKALVGTENSILLHPDIPHFTGATISGHLTAIRDQLLGNEKHRSQALYRRGA